MADAMEASSLTSMEVSQEFDFETRSVVLSFLGLIPSNILEQSFSSSRGTSSADSHDVSEHSHSHSRGDSGALSSLPKETMAGKVSRLGSSDDDDPYTFTMDNGMDETEDTVDVMTPRADIQETLDELLRNHRDNDEIDNLRPQRKREGTGERHKLSKHASFDNKMESLMKKRNSEDSAELRRRKLKAHSHYMSPTAAAARPKQLNVHSFLSVEGGDGKHVGEQRVSPSKQLLHRRDSEFSGDSEITVSVQSSRSSYVDVQTVDLEPLVKSNLINPNMVPLKEELRQEKQQLEDSFHKSRLQSPAPRGPPGTPAGDLSPEEAVAQYLCVLGDQVQERYSSMLAAAFQSVSTRPVEELTYRDLQAATEDMTGQTTGWTKIALVMMLSKRLTYNVLASGGKGVRKVTDFTARLIEDTAASFILEKGGWHAITELELETPCTPSDVLMRFPPTDAPPLVDADNAPTVTGTPADATSSTVDDLTDHEDHEELPLDPKKDSSKDETGDDGDKDENVPKKEEEEDAKDQPDAAPVPEPAPILVPGATSAGDDDSGDNSDSRPTPITLTVPSSPRRTVEEEARDNVRLLRADIPFWRQQSGEYSRQMEEERSRVDEEQRLWRHFTYGAVLGTLGIAAVLFLAWKRNGTK